MGKLSEAIRACAPKTLNEWRAYYMEKVPEKHVPPDWVRLGSTMEEHLKRIGERLFVKITEQLRSELEAITEEDCIAYVEDVVIRHTYEGYITEQRTVYGLVQSYLRGRGINLPINPAPPEWERKYNLDFYIPIDKDYPDGKIFVGLQIKPITYESFESFHSWNEWMRDSHNRFKEDFAGEVVVVFSYYQDGQKVIANEEALEKIKSEVERLRKESGFL